MSVKQKMITYMAGNIRGNFGVIMLGFVFVEKVWTVVTKFRKLNYPDMQISKVCKRYLKKCVCMHMHSHRHSITPSLTHTVFTLTQIHRRIWEDPAILQNYTFNSGKMYSLMGNLI